MHFSRMRTARLLTYPTGGSATAPQVCLWWEGVGQTPSPLWTEGMTHTYEKITLPHRIQRPGWGGKKHEIYVAAFGGHFFISYLYRAGEGHGPLGTPLDPLLLAPKLRLRVLNMGESSLPHFYEPSHTYSNYKHYKNSFVYCLCMRTFSCIFLLR